MKLLEKFLEFLNGEMVLPIAYQSLSESWFHYLAIVLILVTTYLVVKRFKNASDHQYKLLLLIFSVILLTFEVYKQLLISYHHNWVFQWRTFPFHMCSTPMYLALIAVFLKKGKFQNAIFSFLATYSLLAGTYVALVDPSSVLRTSIGISIQTMVHHGAMIVVGLTILINRSKLVLESFVGAILVYLGGLIIAVGMNILHNQFINTDQVFNMYYLNPQHEINTVLLVGIQKMLPFPIFLILIFSGFTAITYIFLLIRVYGFKAVSLCLKSKTMKSVE